MGLVAWLSKAVTGPVLSELIAQLPAVAKALAAFFESHAARAETKAAVIQTKAAGAIADNTKRAEALREASRRLSDDTQR